MNMEKEVLNFKEGDIVTFTYCDKVMKGVCISKKKFTSNILVRFDNIKIVYTFFTEKLNLLKVIETKRNKKSYFLMDKPNKKHRKTYLDIL